jgi:bacteriocin-like protein
MSKETQPIKESKTKADPRLQTRPKGEVQLTEKELDKVVGGSTVLGGWNRVKNV